MDFSAAFAELVTPDISDACDALGIPTVTTGAISPVYEGCRPVVGPVVTVKLSEAGTGNTVMGTLEAIVDAAPGSVLVFAVDGRPDLNAWGSIAATTAVEARLNGVIIDGVTRDVQMSAELDFPTYAKGTVVTSVRDRVGLDSINEPVEIEGQTIEPGWISAADVNGVIFFPPERAEEVVRRAWAVAQLERKIMQQIRQGADPLEIHRAMRYDGSVRDQLDGAGDE